MKIQSIPNFYLPKNQIKKSNDINKQTQECFSTKTNNFNDYNYNRYMVNFKSSAVPPSKCKYSLEKRISLLCSRKNTVGNAVAIGKNITEVVSNMKKISNELEVLIDKICFIKDCSIASPLLFVRESLSELILYNLGEQKITINTNTETEVLEENDYYLIENELDLYCGKKCLNINPYDHNNMTSYELSDKVYDFENLKEKCVQNYNKDLLSLLVKDKTPNIDTKSITFQDVGGLDNVIKTLKKTIVYPIKAPYAYENRKVHHGVLMYGPPGTGKTLLAQALANEINAKLISMNGLELKNKYVGQTEENWRKLFASAKENQPCVIFLDEFDAVAKKRGGKDVYGDDTLNQILTLITDIDNSNDNVFIIAATNLPENLDPAIIRSGRLGKIVEVPPPNKDALGVIFDIHTKKQKLDNDVNKEVLLNEFEKRKFVGADIKAIVIDAVDESWERLNIYEKIENNTLIPDDIKNITIKQEDFINALSKFKGFQQKNQINKIGFNKQ